MKPNIKLLRSVVEWVEAESTIPKPLRATRPLYWDQEGYLETTECGTACCVAGKIAYDFSRRPSGRFFLNERFQTVTDKKTGVALHVSYFAQQKLRITPEQANSLFDGDNRAADIRRIAEEIAGGKL